MTKIYKFFNICTLRKDSILQQVIQSIIFYTAGII